MPKRFLNNSIARWGLLLKARYCLHTDFAGLAYNLTGSVEDIFFSKYKN
jgi:hypothetical protein